MPQIQRLPTQAQRLLSRINTLSESGVPTSDALSDIESKAKDLLLLERDVAVAYVVLGAVACLRKDVKEMKEYFGYALVQSKNDPWVLSNFSTSLFKLCLFDEAKKYALQVYELSGRKDHGMLLTLIEAATLSGKLEEASGYVAEGNKHTPHLSHPICADVEKASEALQRHDISDDAAEGFLKTAYNILNQHGYHADSVDFCFLDDDILYRVNVNNVDIDSIVDMNFELADSEAKNNFIPDVSEAITVMYMSGNA
jgi:tetratricopeptide (TPR) repeat protein